MTVLVQHQHADHPDSTDEPANWPMVISMKEGPVCVSIVEQPRHLRNDSTCHCGGCRGSIEADWAERFLP